MPDFTLHLGDCLDVLKGLPDGSVDAVVTDPPFGVRSEEWDNMDAREFARFSMAWLAEANRVGRKLISFCSAYGPFRPLCEMLWPRVQVMFWDKPIGSQYAGASESGLWFAHETILHGYTPIKKRCKPSAQPRLLPVAAIIREHRVKSGLPRGSVDVAVRGRKTGLCYRWEEGACLPTPEQSEVLKKLLGLNGEYDNAMREALAAKDETLARARVATSEMGREYAARARDVFTYRTETNVVHPCQKPVALLSELVERLTASDATVLDPFMGSGTTGVACMNTGRNFIGVEIDKGYHAIAERRIREAKQAAESKLFAVA